MLFLLNIYFCLMMVMHGATMSNDDISSWNYESFTEVFMAAVLYDPILVILSGIYSIAQGYFEK
jgi:hypothetical protein